MSQCRWLMRRNVLVPLLVLVLLAVLIAWYLRRGSSSGGEDGPAGRVGSGAGSSGSAGSSASTSSGSRAAAGSNAKPPSSRAEARAKRDALREQIARQLATREAQTGSGSASGAPPRSPTDPWPPGNLLDRTGGHQAVAERLNRDFMPLASECIEQAQERAPQLSGMLVLGFETIADEQLGAVVEVADPTPRNAVADPLLLECLRESALSLSLPPLPANGRDTFELSIPVEPVGDAGVPR
jgi:hypothetical protein